VRARLRHGNTRRASARRAQKGSRRKSRSGKQLAKYLTALQNKSGAASGNDSEVRSGQELRCSAKPNDDRYALLWHASELLRVR
jgi:hypothetical protein